jgi:tRNA nucleotidyltransferase (CCA-adding enzyme)
VTDHRPSDDELRARLRRAVPAEVREVCAALTAAGHQAVTVGGAVRDAMLGRDPGDWDVATSAHPEQVQALFKRTIPTGIAHGTITVMAGKGERRIGVEVTTFRGEGAYSDARRPDSVTFGVPLTEDLARRDFVINAIAYDPIGDAIFDPFGGQDDVAARRVRAVGDAVARFTEDGLRVMRAVRFAAVLEFDLDAATEAGIGPALPSLARVSQERVHDELGKLLGSRQPSRGLAIARRTGILEVVLPEVAAVVDDAAWAAVLARVDAGAGPLVRMAALLSPVAAGLDGDERGAAAGDARAAAVVDAALRRLKFANDDRDRVVRAVRVFPAIRRAWSDAGLRRVLAGVGRGRAAEAVALWRAAADGNGDAAAHDLAQRAQAILDAGHPLAVGELALGGGELMSALGIPPGRRVGEILAALLEQAIEDPAINDREQLLAIARQL